MLQIKVNLNRRVLIIIFFSGRINKILSRSCSGSVSTILSLHCSVLWHSILCASFWLLVRLKIKINSKTMPWFSFTSLIHYICNKKFCTCLKFMQNKAYLSELSVPYIFYPLQSPFCIFQYGNWTQGLHPEVSPQPFVFYFLFLRQNLTKSLGCPGWASRYLFFIPAIKFMTSWCPAGAYAADPNPWPQ